jgi:hypothetical protein
MSWFVVNILRLLTQANNMHHGLFKNQCEIVKQNEEFQNKVNAIFPENQGLWEDY